MNYEEKYKQALSRAIFYNGEWPTKEQRKMLEEIFPELKENEDEKIRKVLLNDFKNNCSEYYCEGVTRDMVIAWLEKQKEFVSADFDDVCETADCDELTAPLEKYSKDAIKKMCHAWYDKGIELERRNWLEKPPKRLYTDKVIAWLVANICDYDYYVKLFKKDFGI